MDRSTADLLAEIARLNAVIRAMRAEVAVSLYDLAEINRMREEAIRRIRTVALDDTLDIALEVPS